LTDHSKLWTKGEQIKATNLSNFVWKLCCCCRCFLPAVIYKQ
jgi:hypothetical protein